MRNHAPCLLDGIAPYPTYADRIGTGQSWERQDRRDYAIEGALDRHVTGPVTGFYHKVTRARSDVALTMPLSIQFCSGIFAVTSMCFGFPPCSQARLGYSQ